MWKLALSLAALSCLCLAMPLLSKWGRTSRQTWLLLAAVCAFVAMLVGRGVKRSTTITFEDYRPIQVAGKNNDPYSSSTSCKQCHEEQFASWHASYHRTMTQIATPNSVVGSFDDVRTEAYGHQIHLSKRGDEFWATMHDPEQPTTTDASVIERPIVMTTGSHHMQVYWYATGKDRRLGQLPVVWLRETNEWVPIHSIFLRPTQTKLGSAEGRWNDTCIKCHATQGRPRIAQAEPTSIDTHVAEFGIACEACHGPGTEHVQSQLAAKDASSDVLVNPAKLDHQRSSEVCGQCHGVWIANAEEAKQASGHGLSFRPGDTLSETRHVFSSEQPVSEHIGRHLQSDPDFMNDRFWSDGMVRVSGREYNGLIRSPCFQEGELSCVRCHDLHADTLKNEELSGWADDQLASSMDSNQACIQCHESFADAAELVAHTHHSDTSNGSQCYNCHMPHTTYGLLKAIRSHEISSPSVAETATVGRPNACNQCHIDQTLAWTASALKSWYDIDSPTLTDEQTKYSATLLGAITGDAGQRALAAWSLGWKPAQEASRSDWVAPILGQLLNDPYHAVRYVARRSLHTLPAFEELDVDFLAPRESRAQAFATIVSRWRETGANRKEDPALLLNAQGDLIIDELRQLQQKRDDRIVVLAE